MGNGVASAVVVIPARYGSTRFPGKVLAKATGKYLVQHVYERVCRARWAGRVIIAAEDARTVTAAGEFGADVVSTDPDLPSGTDRVAAVAESLGDADVIINVQGDEPEIDPSCVDQLAELMAGCDSPMGTLATPFGEDDPADPNAVKVVCDREGYALYFSRSLVPYPRDGRQALPTGFVWLRHVGIYAYRRAFLLKLSQLAPSPLEQVEKLEQLRALWHGHRIKVGITSHRSVGVDTREDYERFVRRHAQTRKDG